MPAKRARPSMFQCGSYDIGELGPGSRCEITIRSAQAPAPRCGDRFTIVRDQALHDLTVLNVTRSGGDWSARCSVAAAV